ncbi:hypothetical protein HK102_000129, partial [Quaeritorhiza haematococci]
GLAHILRDPPIPIPLAHAPATSCYGSAPARGENVYPTSTPASSSFEFEFHHQHHYCEHQHNGNGNKNLYAWFVFELLELLQHEREHKHPATTTRTPTRIPAAVTDRTAHLLFLNRTPFILTARHPRNGYPLCNWKRCG